MYITILVIQIHCISQVSGERLQDHWSSGYKLQYLACNGVEDCVFIASSMARPFFWQEPVTILPAIL